LKTLTVLLQYFFLKNLHTIGYQFLMLLFEILFI